MVSEFHVNFCKFLIFPVEISCFHLHSWGGGGYLSLLVSLFQRLLHLCVLIKYICIYFHFSYKINFKNLSKCWRILKMVLITFIIVAFFSVKIKYFCTSTNKMLDRSVTGCHKSTSTARNGLMNLLNSQSLALKQQSSSLIVIIALPDIFKKKRAQRI